jgi:hypothetical protein
MPGMMPAHLIYSEIVEPEWVGQAKRMGCNNHANIRARMMQKLAILRFTTMVTPNLFFMPVKPSVEQSRLVESDSRTVYPDPATVKSHALRYRCRNCKNKHTSFNVAF